jgi:hypothetical protein
MPPPLAAAARGTTPSRVSLARSSKRCPQPEGRSSAVPGASSKVPRAVAPALPCCSSMGAMRGWATCSAKAPQFPAVGGGGCGLLAFFVVGGAGVQGRGWRRHRSGCGVGAWRRGVVGRLGRWGVVVLFSRRSRGAR